MKQAVGIVIGIEITAGLDFGVGGVYANRAKQHPKTAVIDQMDAGSQHKVS